MVRFAQSAPVGALEVYRLPYTSAETAKTNPKLLCLSRVNPVSKIFYRREPFGAVIVYPTQVARAVGTLAAETIEKIVSREPQSNIVDFVCSHEGYEERDVASRFVCECQDLLDDKNASLKLAPKNSAVMAGPFPALALPLDMFWEITRRCNEFCKHCYNNSGPRGFHPKVENIERVIDDFGQVRLRDLTVSGGEPLMHPQFSGLSSKFRKLSFHLSLSTNGTLISEEMADFIAETYDLVNISLDAPVSADYDKFRGRKGSFERCTAGIRRLRQRGVKVMIQSVITEASADRLDELARLLISLSAR